jgi:predicted dienelactone hydrolase
VDEGRKSWQGNGPRPISTIVWYPAAAGSKTGPVHYGDPGFKPYFIDYSLAEDAEISKQAARYPLILLSHGTTSLALSLDWLAYSLASKGYVVAAVNRHGDTFAEKGGPLPQGFGAQWERPKDLSVTADKMLLDPFFGPHIDDHRIAAGGHSAGGATVLELAGARFSAEQIRSSCKSGLSDPICKPQPAQQ